MGDSVQQPLPEGAKILWYVIQSVIGQGGFGVTYLAQDSNLGRWVALKEYLPAEFAVRSEGDTVRPRSGNLGETYAWGLRGFIEEARTLAKFRHPSIVHVHNVFEANGTAYIVMEYERGEDLAARLKRGEGASESDLLAVVLPITEGLAIVHEAGFIHRDITPNNIRIRHQGPSVLIDFGSAREALLQRSRSLTRVVTPRYAPFEQYSTQLKQGPWSDVYSLGACLYTAVCAARPVDAMDRSALLMETGVDPQPKACDEAKGDYSRAFLEAIDAALSFRADDRPQSVLSWAQSLQGLQSVAPQNTAPVNNTVLRPGRLAAAAQAVESAQIPKAEQAVSHQATTVNDAVSAQKTQSDPARPPGSWPLSRITRYVLMSVLLGILVAFALHWLPDRQIRAEDQQRHAWLQRAEKALKQGDWVTPVESSAAHYYQLVKNRFPGDIEARQGLHTVLMNLLERADARMAQNDFAAARQALEQAGQLGIGADLLAQVKAKLATQAAVHQRFGELLRDIENSIAQQDVHKALAVWQQARAEYPYDAQVVQLKSAIDALSAELQAAAQTRQNERLTALLSEAQQALDKRDWGQAQTVLEAAQSLAPTHAEVLALQARLDAEQARQAQANTQLQAAQRAQRDGRYQQALDNLQKLLAVIPDHAAALELQRQLQQQLETQKKVARERKQPVATVSHKPVFSCPKSGNNDVAAVVFTLKTALTDLNLRSIKRVSRLDSSTASLLNSLRKSYSQLTVRSASLRFNRSQCEGTALLHIERAVNQAGDTVSPAKSWRDHQIKVKRSDGRWLAYW